MELDLSPEEQAMVRQISEWTDKPQGEVYRRFANAEESMKRRHAILAHQEALRSAPEVQEKIEQAEVQEAEEADVSLNEEAVSTDAGEQ